MLRALREVMDAPGVIPMRVGVNTGKVFTGDFGPPYRRAYRVFGDAINTAARVMSRAERRADPLDRDRARPVAHDVRDDADRAVPRQGEGGARPRARSSARSSARRGERGAETPLVGRDAELAALLAVHRRRAHGERLDRRDQRRRRARQVPARPGAGRPLAATSSSSTRAARSTRRSTPYFALARADAAAARARAACGRGRGRAPPARGRRPDRPDARAVGAAARDPARARPAADARDEQLSTSASCASALADVAMRFLVSTLGGTADDARGRGRPLHGRGERRPAPAPVAGGRLAAARARRHPLRPGDHVGPVGRRGPALPRVHPAAALRAAARPRSSSIATDDQPLSAARRRGDRAALRAATCCSSSSCSTWPARRGSTAALPDSVEAVIAGDIDRLSPSDRTVLRYASVLGASFDPEPAGRGARTARWSSTTRSGSGCAGSSTRTRPGVMRFRNTLVRDAAYEGLPFRRRRELHARVGGGDRGLGGHRRSRRRPRRSRCTSSRPSATTRRGTTAGSPATVPRAVAANVEAATLLRARARGRRHVRGLERQGPGGRLDLARRGARQGRPDVDASFDALRRATTAAGRRSRRAGAGVRETGPCLGEERRLRARVARDLQRPPAHGWSRFDFCDRGAREPSRAACRDLLEPGSPAQCDRDRAGRNGRRRSIRRRSCSRGRLHGSRRGVPIARASRRRRSTSAGRSRSGRDSGSCAPAASASSTWAFRHMPTATGTRRSSGTRVAQADCLRVGDRAMAAIGCGEPRRGARQQRLVR